MKTESTSPEGNDLTGFDARYDMYRQNFINGMGRSPSDRERDQIFRMDGLHEHPEHLHAAEDMLDWLDNWIRQKKKQDTFKKTRIGRMYRKMRICYKKAFRT
ncbi:MAG: hypothetical protein ABL890_04095 [Candidatus Peribacteraceae bacterium]